MTDSMEISRYRYVRLQGGLMVCFAAIFTYVLWHLHADWPLLLIGGLILIPLGGIGFKMLVRRPQAVLWLEDNILHWHEDSCVPFQRGWKGSLPVTDIAHVRSICKPLIDSHFYELEITTADGELHKMPPNISSLTQGRRLTELLLTLRNHHSIITFEKIQTK